VDSLKISNYAKRVKLGAIKSPTPQNCPCPCAGWHQRQDLSGRGDAEQVIFAGVLRVAITRGTVRFVMRLDQPGAYDSHKHQIGRSLLLGLEFLVAGDVVRTVVLKHTLGNVAALGVLVLVRTFLAWSLTVEIEGRWPWQPRNAVPSHSCRRRAAPVLAQCAPRDRCLYRSLRPPLNERRTA